ncbi:glycoside hydrolase superfamily [Xylariaceae sp. FL0255]|nr:glycoside hydrolase superfamily [Xylariaceae sp. FL0255]
MKYTKAGLVAALSGVATAQVAMYGQCGGTGYTGSTVCASGSYCLYQNTYYSQCVPGTASTTLTTSKTTTAASSGTKTTTTVSKTTTSASKTTTTGTSSSTGFPSTSGTKFNIDGKVQYYAGTNAYWMSFLTSDSDVDTAMSTLAADGLKILRVWGFNDVTSNPGDSTIWFQLLSASGSTINTGTNGLQRLDAVVAAAETYDIKLIINFVNNWSDYGGIAAYNTAFGGNATTWFTDSASQTQYKKYIQAVVSRYSSSSAIFAWELANEPRCTGCDVSVITNWATTISAYIKSLDSNHMVTLGDEGFGLDTDSDGSYPFTYGAGGTNFTALLEVPDLDFGTFHLYPNSWGTAYTWGDLWIQAHGAACAAAGKPCLLEEYGAPSNHCSIEAPWQETALSTAGIAGDMFWQYGTTLSFGQTSDDGNTIFTGTSDWTCLVTDHVADI